MLFKAYREERRARRAYEEQRLRFLIEDLERERTAREQQKGCPICKAWEDKEMHI